MRAGVYELQAREKTPARVIITEYVDVAHAFYDGQEPGMVNGMLDRIVPRQEMAEAIGSLLRLLLGRPPRPAAEVTEPVATDDAP